MGTPGVHREIPTLERGKATVLNIMIRGTQDQATAENLGHAVAFFCGQLMPQKLIDKLTITIELHGSFNAYILDGQLDNGTVGHCFPIDAYYRPKQFKMALLEGDETYLAMAHESVHMAQMAMGKLTLVPTKKKMRWQNMLYPIPIGDCVEQFDSPWEIEAFGLERSLYYKLQQSLLTA